MRLPISFARKAVTDFKKVSRSRVELADLMLHYVEMGVRFTNEYGDIDEPFYNSMESMYDNVLKLIVEEKMRDQFQYRCNKIVIDTSGIGWGFHDALGNMYHDTFD